MRALLQHLGVLALLLLSSLGLGAQNIVAQRLDELEVPSRDVVGIYHGPRGGIYVLVDRDGAQELRVHDGERWQLSHRLSAAERVLPSLTGELLLTDGREVFTFEWRFRAPASRVGIGRLRRTYVITRATYLLNVDPGGTQRHPEVILETDRGILVSQGGSFHAVTATPARLVGVSPDGAFVANRAGEIYAAGRRDQVVATLPTGLRDVSAVATTSGGDILFRGDDDVFLLQIGRAERYRLRRLAEVPPTASLSVVGNRLLSLTAEEPLRYCDLDNPTVWHPIPHGSAEAQAGFPQAIGGAASFYSIGSRAIVRTQTGVVSVETVPSVVTPVKIDAALTSAIGAAGAGLVVGQPDAVKVYGTHPGALVEPSSNWPTFDNHMRNSVPTCVTSFDDRVVVGTSDGRVLALNASGPPDQLTSVVGYGMEFSDLYVSGEVLWATFNPSSGRNSGLVKITRAGSALQLDSTGLNGSVACVRRAPGGQLYAASRHGDSPLHYHFSAHNIWMKLEGRIEMATNQQGFQIHEIAPASDSLIYIATSRGLLQWRPGLGYGTVPMPHDLLDADIRSLRLADGGLWFTVQGQGAYFLRDGSLHTVEGRHNWASFDFQPRGLMALANGDILLLNAGRVIKLQSPTGDYVPLRPGIIFANHPRGAFATRAAVGWRHSLWQGDSLYVHYALPGFAPSNLVAAFTIAGATVRPARSAPGLAVFAPMQPGDYDLSIRVISREKGYSASVHMLSVRVMPYWWTTAFGVFVITGLSTLLACCLVSGYTLRQRTLARELEALVAERTRDLQIAQDKAQRASAAKSMFLANMSHEIRTPLNAVLGMGSLLLESPLTDEQRGFADAIQRGGSALHGIVGDILDFAEIDNGSVKKRDGVTDLSGLMHELVATYGAYAAGKGLFFAYDIAPLPAKVLIDAQKLRSAVSHLLGNAVKFTLSGSVRLEVRHEPYLDGGGDQLTVRVSDTGIGVDPADAERIFDVFEQADNSNTRRFGGTGLGLAIVKTYVECLSGDVHLASAPGQGSAFTLRLPLQLTERHVVQPVLVPEEDLVHVGAASDRPELLAQLRRLFSDGPFSMDLHPGGGAAPDVLLYGWTDDASLVAFRQNELYRRTLAAGGSVGVVCEERPGERPELRDGEEGIAYPLNPSQLAELAARWRARKCERHEGGVAASTQGEGAPGATAAPPAAETTAGAAVSDRVRTADSPCAPDPATAPAPATTAPQPTPPPPIAPPPTAKPVFFDLAAERPLGILVAEDNPMNKMLILTVLTKLGYKADWVENGRLAVDRFAASPYDLILMDIHMPEMDGLQATVEIRERFGERPVTICALTANASEEGRLESLAVGMDEFMTKPLQVPALIALLRRVEPLASRMLSRETPACHPAANNLAKADRAATSAPF